MARLSILVLAAIAAGCTQPAHELVPVPAPDGADLEPSVRAALARARAEFDRVAAGKPAPVELGNAYGELAMTYQAQSLVPPAEAAYRNARTLAPRDARWAYLLGHLYNDASRVPEAIGQFEAALAIDGRDGPTLFSLGEACLQHGDFDKARSMYRRLLSVGDARAAALAGLGKVALAEHRYREAADDLEKALQLSPASSRLRQPLASAYRGLGDLDKAEQNLRQFSTDGMEPGIADPLAEALDEKVAASRTLVRRGQRFGRAGASTWPSLPSGPRCRPIRPTPTRWRTWAFRSPTWVDCRRRSNAFRNRWRSTPPARWPTSVWAWCSTGRDWTGARWINTRPPWSATPRTCRRASTWPTPGCGSARRARRPRCTCRR
jgi:Flp pilus assembly protein TadD